MGRRITMQPTGAYVTRQPEPRRKVQIAVIAAADIPAHSCTPVILLDTIIRAKADKIKYELELNKSGHLIEKSNGSIAWVRHTRVSRDCHSFNVMVLRVPGISAVKLQTVRELKAGEEVCLWFDEDVLASAGIPFLTPSNIQGEKNYICHRCRKHFEYPNPLKIHLSLECGSLRRIELWKRLIRTEEIETETPSVNEAHSNVYSMKHRDIPFKFKEFTKCVIAESSSPETCDLSTTSNPSHFSLPKSGGESHRPSSEPAVGRFSAFKPYFSFQTLKTDNSEYKFKGSLISVPSNLIFSSPPLSSNHMPREETSSFTSLGLNRKAEDQSTFIDQQAVEMETLVSNLGRSKQGHLCIYCGKIYSRKYGLKIHIRTHTGFKPLKCKFCLRPFGDPSNLNKHVRLHAEGETPYKCEECGKVLVRRRDLERHMKSRHQQEGCL